MIDFKEEVKKFRPVLENEDLEREINAADATDIVKLLHYMAKNIKTEKSSKTQATLHE